MTEFRFPELPKAAAAIVPGRANIVDGESFTLAAAAEVGELPFTSRFSCDGTTVFVANVKTGSVSVLDVASGAVRATLDSNIGATFGGTHGMCVVPAS